MAKESENYCAPDRGTQLLLLCQGLHKKYSCCSSCYFQPKFCTVSKFYFWDVSCFSWFFMGQVVKKHLDLENYIFPSKTLLPDFLSKFLLPDFVRKMGQFVKVREMWVTGGANSLPHPFLERPKVRLTHWYGVVSHFVKHRVKNWALSKLARHKYCYQLMRLISAVGELEQFKCSCSWIKFEKETFLI